MVPSGSRIADIGTDHGYVPICLAEEGRILSALAMDVREGPLARAREHVEEYRQKARSRGLPECPIEVRLSDGLKELKAGEADTVIIAGMGGELELYILEEGKALWDSIRTWILSPQSDLHKVRHYLADHGFFIQDEVMLKEDGKFYTVMKVVRGTMKYEGEAQYLYGRKLIEKQDPVLKEYLEKEENRIRQILGKLSPGHSAAAERQQELIWIKEAQDEML